MRQQRIDPVVYFENYAISCDEREEKNTAKDHDKCRQSTLTMCTSKNEQSVCYYCIFGDIVVTQYDAMPSTSMNRKSTKKKKKVQIFFLSFAHSLVCWFLYIFAADWRGDGLLQCDEFFHFDLPCIPNTFSTLSFLNGLYSYSSVSSMTLSRPYKIYMYL